MVNQIIQRLLSIPDHNSVIISMPENKALTRQFRLLLIQGLIKKRRCAVPHCEYGHPSTELPSERPHVNS
jgi:hypothetical protein